MAAKLKIGMPVENIDTPALLVDLDALEANIAFMADFFAGRPAALRPHVKTHKCPELARRQIATGAVGITAAKVSEAEVFAEAGIEDILIANQVTGEVKIQRLTDLAQTCDLMVAVDDPKNVERLERFCAEKEVQIRVLVEVDIGMKRCGVQPGEDTLRLAQLVDQKPHLQFRGLQAYEGHLVLVDDPEQREEQVKAAFLPLQETCELLRNQGLEPEIVSGGGTGTYDVSGTATPLNEIQVGSYVFMDATYHPIRPEFKQALTVLSTVLSRPVPERLVTDAGLKSMTSEFGWPHLLGSIAAKMEYLSEEHAVLTLESPQNVPLGGGDRVQFRPSHVCTTVNLHDQYYLHRGGILVDVWPIEARGCSQ